jgi:hypothetical protein
MLKTAIANVSKIAEGAWESELSPDEVEALGRSFAQEPGPSVLLADEVEESDKNTILFPPNAVRVLNRGTAKRAFVLARPNSDASLSLPRGCAGDDAFLKEAAQAGREVEEFARRMLREVRRLDPTGELVSFPGRRFINKPDNFVVLVPQPRIQELKIVVRGGPREFRDAPDDLKSDQNGYSTFKIRNATDLARGISLLKQVRRK